MAKNGKLTREQIIAIPTLINKKELSVGDVAKLYGVSWQCVWYWCGRLKADGFKVKTRPKGYKKIILGGQKKIIK